MTQKRSKYIVAGMFAAIAVFLGWRIIWNWPVNIKGTGPVNELEIRRDSVSVKLNQGATVARVVDLNTLEWGLCILGRDISRQPLTRRDMPRNPIH